MTHTDSLAVSRRRCRGMLFSGGLAALAGFSLSALFVIQASLFEAFAATVSTNFTVQIVIQADCQIVTANMLDFGTTGALTADVDAQTSVQVQCTNSTPYNVGLNAGSTAGGTIATRKMESGGATVDYRMYSNAGRTTNWGDTVGADAVPGTGNGSPQTLTIYGRVPVQTTPAPSTYTDQVTITVTY